MGPFQSTFYISSDLFGRQVSLSDLEIFRGFSLYLEWLMSLAHWAPHVWLPSYPPNTPHSFLSFTTLTFSSQCMSGCLLPQDICTCCLLCLEFIRPLFTQVTSTHSSALSCHLPREDFPECTTRKNCPMYIYSVTYLSFTWKYNMNLCRSFWLICMQHLYIWLFASWKQS